MDISAKAGGLYASSLPRHEYLNQVLLVKGCLAAGIPLNALNHPLMKAFFEHIKINIPSSNHLGKHVTVLAKEEVNKVIAAGRKLVPYVIAA